MTMDRDRRQEIYRSRDTGYGGWVGVSGGAFDSVPTSAPTAVNQARVSGVYASILGAETYLEINVKGIVVQCLVDSGCDHSVLPRKRAITATLSPSNMELIAANGTQIPVIGEIRLEFTVNGGNVPFYADFLVTYSVDECILGYDWLKRNSCQWHFDQAILVIAGVPLKLKHRPSRVNVRRIYAREAVSVPANSRANVPVRMPFLSLRTPTSDWVIEAKELRPGVFMGRTLLSGDDTYAAMQFVNLSDKCHKLNGDLFFGIAEPGIVLGPDAGAAAYTSRTADEVTDVVGRSAIEYSANHQ